jgi:Fe-S oxidoreductase
VPLEHLADYTAKLTDIFEKYGTRGTWYAHASVGCLHVRPVLNLRLDKDVKAMRAIAEEAFTLVRAYKGSHSGEHGDGIVRSEFHESMFGERLVAAFERVKSRFDPKGLYNPGKIVRAPRFDDRRNFRYPPAYHGEPVRTHLDWSAFPGTGGGFQGAVEMCNNNGACRTLQGGVMCPSYRVTRDERDVTRGRANTLRLAVTGQLGANALTSEEMHETLKLCVSCKACRRECPTGVDIARMKIEVQAARAAKYGSSLHDRMIGYLPRYAPFAARWPYLANLRNRSPRLRKWSEQFLGLSARRDLPSWRKPWREPASRGDTGNGKSVALFVDTFNRYFEPENIDAAIHVLGSAGFAVHLPKPDKSNARPLCCGRTFLSVGLVEEARREAERTVAALTQFALRGIPVVGLEPSCVFGFRDEIPGLVKNNDALLLARSVVLFEEFLAEAAQRRALALPLKPVASRALVHGHCHQKAFGAMGALETVLKLVPELDIEVVETSCCGMAGSFGYGADTIDVSSAMGELSLLPAIRKASAETLVLADGVSCRAQIKDGTGRNALHVARLLSMSIDRGATAAQ